MYHQAVSLANAGRNVDQYLLLRNQTCKRALAFMAYAERHELIRRIGTYKWELTLSETAIQVRPREVGYDQPPLGYAWNELQDILSV